MRPPLVAAVACVAVAGVLVFGGACGDDGTGAAETPTTAGVERIVALETGQVAGLTVETDEASVEVDASDHHGLAPLRAARSFDPVEALSSYGLDPPRARLVYTPRSGEPVVVEIGGTTVDDAFVYVRRQGDDRIFLAVHDTLASVLALLPS